MCIHTVRCIPDVYVYTWSGLFHMCIHMVRFIPHVYTHCQVYATCVCIHVVRFIPHVYTHGQVYATCVYTWSGLFVLLNCSASVLFLLNMLKIKTSTQVFLKTSRCHSTMYSGTTKICNLLNFEIKTKKNKKKIHMCIHTVRFIPDVYTRGQDYATCLCTRGQVYVYIQVFHQIKHGMFASCFHDKIL